MDCLNNLIIQLDMEIEQLKHDDSSNIIIGNIAKEYSHEYECLQVDKGFSFRISGGNEHNNAYKYFYFNCHILYFHPYQ